MGGDVSGAYPSTNMSRFLSRRGCRGGPFRALSSPTIPLRFERKMVCYLVLRCGDITSVDSASTVS